uniref:Putative mucin-5ac-like protein n=1 Tax=Lutzomyia longipalpis TaxID=7200 RepID=A0A1B0CKK7_LUTLO
MNGGYGVLSQYSIAICIGYELALAIDMGDILLGNESARSSGPTARAFGVNPKQSTSTANADFDCPEEFGYYPHPTDCTQYYVCVFGSALLESCTGGLMYSHELQTCDWPRNVGCDAAEAAAAPSTPATRQQQQQPQVTRVPQIQQVQPQKIRFTSVPSVIAGPSAPAQIQSLPPPPELRVAPNPVITSRGQPKQVSLQEDIAQLYADAHDTLPPAEEEESDRQQRVYRGQPSTVGQVQRDRDGIFQQSSVNAIPSHGKVGSYAFGSQVNQYSEDALQDVDNGARTKTRHDRKKRDVQTDEDLETSDLIPEAAALYAPDDDGQVRQVRQLRAKTPWAFGGFQTNTHKHLSGFHPPPLVDTNINQYFTSTGQHVRTSLSNPFGVYNPKTSFSGDNIQNAFAPAAYGGFDHPPPPPREKPRKNNGDLVPVLIHPLSLSHQTESQPKPTKDTSHELEGLPDNFSFFHYPKGSVPTGGGSSNIQSSKPHQNFNYLPNTTPKSSFVAFSTVGGFYNNKPTPATTSDKYLKQHYRLQQDGRPVDATKPLNPTSEIRPGFYAYNIFNNPEETGLITTTPAPSHYNGGFYSSGNQQQKPNSSKPPGFQPIRSIYSNSGETTKSSFHITQSPPTEKPPIVHESYTQTPTTMHIGTPAGPKNPHNGLGFNSDTFVRKPSVINPNFSNLDFSQFVTDIRQSHLSSADPDTVKGPLREIGKNHSFISMSTPRPFNYLQNVKTTPKPLASDEEYYYDSSEEEVPPQKSTKVPPSSQFFRPSTVVRPYNDNNFIKSVPPPNFGKNPPKSTPPPSSEEYYYDDDYEVFRPPANKSKFMPMSETMAPRPPPTPSLRPHPTISPTQNFKPSSHRPPHEHVTELDIRLLSGGTSPIPPIIKFPDDIFQDLRPRAPNKTVVRPTTPRPRIKIKDPWKVTTTKGTMQPFTRPHTAPTTDVTTHKIYTVRPSRGRNPTSVGSGNRGTMKWKTAKSTKRPDRLGDLDERLPNRVESSSPASNSYIQPQKVNTQNTRNYYNTTQGQYDQYDPYSYVYDDEVELYRDVEFFANSPAWSLDYSQQYSGNTNQKPQHQSTYRPAIISSSTPTTASPTPTHSSTPYAPVQPHRDAYVHQQPQQYERPAQVYTPDYEDDDVLLSQLEQEGLTPYSQGTREGIRNRENPPIEFVIPTTTQSPYNWDHATARVATATTTLERVVETSPQPRRKFFSTPIPATEGFPRGYIPSGFFINRTHTPFTTPRNLFFKEVLNKTLDTGATSGRPIVSPYKSLETLLTTDSTIRAGTSSLRPVVRNNPTNAQSPPFRSHFLITAAPRNVTSTERSTSVVTTESTTTTTESTTASTTTTSTTASTSSTTTTTQMPAEETTIAEEEPHATETPEVVEDLTAAIISRSRSRTSTKAYSPRGRIKGSYVYTTANTLDIDPTTYAPKLRFIPLTQEAKAESTTAPGSSRKRVIKMRVPQKRLRNRLSSPIQERAFHESSINRDRQQEVIPLEKLFPKIKSTIEKNLTKFDLDSTVSPTDSDQKVVEITDRPVYFTHYKRLSDKPKKHYLENYEFIRADDDLANQANREKFRATVEMPELNVPTESERASFRDNVEVENEEEEEEDEPEDEEEIYEPEDVDDELLYQDRENPLLYEYPVDTESPNVVVDTTTSTTRRTTTTTTTTTPTTTTTTTTPPPTTTEVVTTTKTTTKTPQQSTTTTRTIIPPRASRVNNAIKTTIAASLPRRIPAASLKCTDNSPNAKCNEIPSRS